MITPEDHQLTIISSTDDVLAHAGQIANDYAARNVFTDYLSRKADNTIRRQATDLTRFVEFLNQVGELAGLQLGTGLSEFAQAVAAFPDGPLPDADAWSSVTWGLVEAFRNWMVQQGDAVGSINVRLSTVKSYARLAAKAGVLSAEELGMIRLVAGYAHKEAQRIDERRDASRRGSKKGSVAKNLRVGILYCSSQDSPPDKVAIMDKPFKWRHHEGEIILLCVRWYLRYALSYRDLEEMMADRGLSVDHTTIFRWVQHYAPEIDRRSRPHLKPTNDSWRVDETYVKVGGRWMYLYRAVDSTGQTLDFLLNETRSTRAAKRFFRKVWGGPKRVAPRVINVDQNAAYVGAIRDLKEAGLLPADCERRPVKYLNNLVEQDHRFIQRRVKPGLGFGSYPTAWRTIQGYEVMHMIRKGQIAGVEKGDSQAQQQFIDGLFGLVA